MIKFKVKQILHEKNLDDYIVEFNDEIVVKARLESARAVKNRYGTNPTLLRLNYYQNEEVKYQFNGALLDDFLIRDKLNNLVGTILSFNPSVFALFQHFSYRINFNSHDYFVEEQINLNEGLRIKIFNEDDEVVAIVNKSKITVNYLDNYSVEICDNKYFDLAALFTLFLDINRFNNFDDLIEGELNPDQSLNKELLNHNLHS